MAEVYKTARIEFDWSRLLTQDKNEFINHQMIPENQAVKQSNRGGKKIEHRYVRKMSSCMT